MFQPADEIDFGLTETDPYNDQFDSLGYGSRNIIENMGSILVFALILIVHSILLIIVTLLRMRGRFIDKCFTRSDGNEKESETKEISSKMKRTSLDETQHCTVGIAGAPHSEDFTCDNGPEANLDRRTSSTDEGTVGKVGRYSYGIR